MFTRSKRSPDSKGTPFLQSKSKKRVMSDSMLSPQLKDITNTQFQFNNNENQDPYPNEKTTPGVTNIPSSQGSQGLRRSVGLLNLSIERSPELDLSSSPKFSIRKKKMAPMDIDESNHFSKEVEKWSPFKEMTPSKHQQSLKRHASNSSVSLSPFINDSQRPLLFSSKKSIDEQPEEVPGTVHKHFNKLRKMVALDTTTPTEFPFDKRLQTLPNSSIPFQSPQSAAIMEIDSPNNSPSRPTRHRTRQEKALNKNMFNRKSAGLEVQDDDDFVTPNSYKFVKPLQTAFMSSGLLSKKNRKILDAPINPPETPCKKIPLINMQSSNKQPFAPSNLANVITASSPLIKDNSTPKIESEDEDPRDYISRRREDDMQQTPSGNTSSLSLPRSARAQNTNELRDCLMKFTNDFDESADSIFDDNNDFDDPSTPTRYRDAQHVALAKSTKLSVNTMLSPTPGNINSFAPRTPVDISVDSSTGDLSANVMSSANVSTLLTANSNADEHLNSQFQNVQIVGSGEFSSVYEITFQSVKYAVKRIKTPFLGSKRRRRIFEEVELLKILQENQPRDAEGKEYVINFINDWEHSGHLYIMTEFCENGSLDEFLLESGNSSKIDEWRIWKMIVEISMGLKYIHSCQILHLDLKPANIFITFEGSLKIGDFGMAVKYPVHTGFEREGDREYIAPEIISQQIYDKPADIFSFGLIMLEAAANIILPDNGIAWQKLRSGDLSDAGRLSSTELNLYNDTSMTSKNSTFSGHWNHGGVTGSSYSSAESNARGLPGWTPRFLVDGKARLDTLVKWMISPNPRDRPTAVDILNQLECQYVEIRRKAGAVIFEGEYGPVPDADEELRMPVLVKKLNLGSVQMSSI